MSEQELFWFVVGFVCGWVGLAVLFLGVAHSVKAHLRVDRETEQAAK